MTKKIGVLAVTALVAVLGVGGCDWSSDNANEHDVTGVKWRQPDKIEVYANIDQHPNIVRLCIDGRAVMTTSRDLNAVTRVPEWDTWCAAR